MIRHTLIPLLITASFFVGCGNEIRPDAYITQSSILLTKDNIAHSRITLLKDRLGTITFSRERFQYSSEFVSLSGTWESNLIDSVTSEGDDITVISSITYTGDDDSEYSTYFISNNSVELSVGDTFILTGDQILSGKVVKIERSNIY